MNQFASWEDYRKFASAVRYAQRYVRTPQTDAFLDTVRRTAEPRVSIVRKGWTHLWRAQLGSHEREVELDNESFYESLALPPVRMKPRDRVGREGRVNPKGIPCFYGATTPETAMAEVRPWMGGFVSVGRFEVLDDVKIVDCSKYHSKNPWNLLLDMPLGSSPSPKEIEEAVWTHIDHAFSEPVTDSDDLPDYVPTQILAEVFKAEGYGGVAYKSMLTEAGYNLAFFDPGTVKQLSGELYKTQKVQFKFSDSPVDQYFIDEQGDVVRDVIESVRPLPRHGT
jgi:hypothetical protein